MRYLNTLIYIALIVLVNYAFTKVPLVALPGGTMWPPVSLLVGFVFVARDFAQRDIGHGVIGAMLIGVAISYFMAGPQVALASAAALGAAMYLWARVLYSRAAGVAAAMFSCAFSCYVVMPRYMPFYPECIAAYALARRLDPSYANDHEIALNLALAHQRR